MDGLSFGSRKPTPPLARVAACVGTPLRSGLHSWRHYGAGKISTCNKCPATAKYEEVS